MALGPRSAQASMRLAGKAFIPAHPRSNVRQQAAAFMVLASVVKNQMPPAATAGFTPPQNGVTSLSSGLARLRSMSPSGASRSASVSVSASAQLGVRLSPQVALAHLHPEQFGRRQRPTSGRPRGAALVFAQVRWHRITRRAGASRRRRCSIRRFARSGRFAANTLLPNPSLERTATGKPAREASAVYHPPVWPESAHRRPPLNSNVRPHQQRWAFQGAVQRVHRFSRPVSRWRFVPSSICRALAVVRNKKAVATVHHALTHGRAFAPATKRTQGASPHRSSSSLQPEEQFARRSSQGSRVALVRHARRAVGSGRRHGVSRQQHIRTQSPEPNCCVRPRPTTATR